MAIRSVSAKVEEDTVKVLILADHGAVIQLSFPATKVPFPGFRFEKVDTLVPVPTFGVKVLILADHGAVIQLAFPATKVLVG